MKIEYYLNIIKGYFSSNVLLKQTIRSKMGKKILRRLPSRYRYDNEIIFINRLNMNVFEDTCDTLKSLKTEYYHYMNHEFNFLGTGWKNWDKPITPLNRREKYREIAWQQDIVSGYKFTDKYFSSSLIQRLPSGVDIKIPWELGRLNHWPQLALIAIIDDKKQMPILKEFVDQMTDFMVSNPIGCGVHFYCAMEVSIRAINLLFAYDVFLQIDNSNVMSNEFKKEFERFIYLHGHVIVNNLEYDFGGQRSGNHYLADLCGLLWISMYFKTYELEKWLKTLKNEFLNAINCQFLSDGSNFECSAGYHKLASEISVLGLLALCILDESYLNQDKIFKLLEGMHGALKFFSGIDGNFIQIGDNDSGCVLKLCNYYSGDKENMLRVTFVLSLLKTFYNGEYNEYIRADIGSRFICAYMSPYRRHAGFDISCERVFESPIMSDQDKIEKLQKELVWQDNIKYELDCDLIEKKVQYLPNFGLIKVSFDKCEIYIRTIPNYSQMKIAHAHDDVFHFEIVFKDRRQFMDLGSIVYTSNLPLRHFFASAESHNVPCHKTSIMHRTDVFVVDTNATGETLLDKNGDIYIIVKWDGIVHMRGFRIRNNAIYIDDYSTEPFTYAKPRYYDAYSLGYGQLYTEN